MLLNITSIPHIELNDDTDEDLDLFTSFYVDGVPHSTNGNSSNGEVEGSQTHSFRSTLKDLTESALIFDETGTPKRISREDKLYAVGVMERILNITHEELRKVQVLQTAEE